MQTITAAIVKTESKTERAGASAAHLNLIIAQRTQAIIDIAIVGSTKRFQSAIIAVDASAQTIAIDELFPAGVTAQPGQRVVVALRLDGERRESFSTAVIQRRAGAGYLLQLPESVDYRERRSDYRVVMPRSGMCNGEFFTPGSRRCAGFIRDISPSGIRLEIAEWSPLQAGDVLEELHFELFGLRYQCQAQVRNIRVKNTSGIEIGAAFIDLSRLQQRALERSLMQWQRRQAASVAQQRAVG
jgi:c-di-GMP-binding flagellar brake protein YcgR